MFKTCSLCDGKHYARGWCRNHYHQWYTYGDPLARKYRPKGEKGSYITSNGYVILTNYFEHPNCNNQGQILEHVLVMSESIGRPLRDKENVHHINGDKQDNRIENLELWSTSQPKGQRVEDKVEWALMILQTYAPELLS